MIGFLSMGNLGGDADAVESTPDPLGRVAMFNPATGEWHLRYADGAVDRFFYGEPGDLPLLGDWDCDGVDTVAMFRPANGFIYLRNSNTFGVADIDFFYGIGGDIPLAGDWNGDGCDTFSIYRPSQGKVYVSDRLGTFPADYSFFYGIPGDKPFAGDFDGDGVTAVGLYRDTTGYVYFRNSLSTGVADFEFFYGNPSDRIVAADWDGDGDDTVGIFRPTDRRLFLSNANVQGFADVEFDFGESSWLPVAGEIGVPLNPGDTKNCSDFSDQPTAQRWFDLYFAFFGDIANLDADNDGIACESGRSSTTSSSTTTSSTTTTTTTTLPPNPWDQAVLLAEEDASGRPRIAAADQTVAVAWTDYTLYNRFGDENTETFIRLSFDGGDSWEEPVNVSDSPIGDYEPDIVVTDSGAVVAAWGEDRTRCGGCPENVMFARRSVDGTWTTQRFEQPRLVLMARLSVSGSHIYYVSGASDWLFAASHDDGRTWSEPAPPSGLSTDSGDGSYPAVAAQGLNVTVMWRDIRDNRPQPELYARYSSDGGATWGTDQRITNSAFREMPPELVVRGNQVIATWITATSKDNGILYVAVSSDLGRTWGDPIEVTQLSPSAHRLQSENVARPVIVAHDGGFELLTYTDSNVRFSSEDGVTWTETVPPLDVELIAFDADAHDRQIHLTSGRNGQAVSYTRLSLD